MKHSQKVLFKRITSGMLSILLVVGTVLNPVTMLPAFATDNLVKLDYENHNKKDVELYVQADEVNYRPGDEMALTLYVQNNSEEALKGIGLSWDGDKDAFEEAEFIGAEELGAEINEKGNVVNLNLEAGEVVSVDFVGTLSDDLDDLNRREISFFYGAETESGENVTDRTSFEFTVGLFNELSMEFVDGNELVPDETAAIDIKMSFNDLGYYYEAEVEEEEIVEVATDSNTIVATDSNTETATDSDAELATDSNSDEEEDVDVATDSNTEDDVEIASDSDSEEEEEAEEYVFEITGVSLNLDTYGAEFKHVVLADTKVTEGKAEIETTALFELDDDAEVGEYFGTLQAVVKSGKKEFKAEIGFQFEVVDETITTGFKKHGLFTAELDNFTVNVQVPKGAFDEKVELSVTELAEDSEKFKEAEEAMANHDRQYDGMMALDICFLNEDGEEVEPKEGYNVQVSIEMNADVLPEGTDTESLMVHHIAETATASDAAEVELVVEDVADTAAATEGLIEMKEEDEAPVVAAEFEVEGFSTFTITWVNGKNIIVNYVTVGNNGSYNDLYLKGVQSATVTANSSFDLAKYAPTNPIGSENKSTYKTDNITYKFTRAEFVYNGITYTYANVSNNSIRWSSTDGCIQYYDNRETNTWKNMTAGATLNLVYTKIEPGNTFKGIDTSGLINIHLKNFGSGNSWDTGNFKINNQDRTINNWTEYGGGVVQGIVAETLVNGYPALAEKHYNKTQLKDPSFAKYFSGGVDANYLFQMDEKGYYYYDSDLNAAHLKINDDNKTGEFELYATPHALGNYYSGSEPQFMPYYRMAGGDPVPHQVNADRWNGYKNYDYTYYPYIDDKGNIIGPTPASNAADYYFGMFISFEFIMPKDGEVLIKDPSGNVIGKEAMVFEFDGDDDVWVFIDNELVLDLGGVHLINGGKIDFKDGTITVDNVQGTGKVVKNFVPYADYSPHTLKFFYMERGAGGSNCKLRFNLQTIPEGTINFEKELGYYNVKDASDIDFKFNAYVNYDGVGEDYELYTGAYEIYNDADDKNYAYRGDASDTSDGKEAGLIKLKHRQMARLINTEDTQEDKKITAKSTFYIKEIGATSDKYNVVINDVSIDSSTNNGSVQNDEGVTSKIFKVSENPYVKFKNNITAANRFNLRVQKELSSGVDTTTVFKFNVLLGAVDPVLYTGQYDVYAYSDNKVVKVNDVPREATDGVISLNAGQFAEIVGLMGGNTIKVQEIGLNADDYDLPTYSIDGPIQPNPSIISGSNEIQGDTTRIYKDTGYVLGVAKEGKYLNPTLTDTDTSNDEGAVVTVTVANSKKVKYAPVTISKVVEGNLGDWSKDFTFTVSATNMPVGTTLPTTKSEGLVEGNGSYIYNNDDGTATVTLKHNESITLKQVPIGAKITVIETDYSKDNYRTTHSVNGGTPISNLSTSEISLTKDGLIIAFTNTKNADIDTGISMDTLPYILIMLAVIGGIAFTIIRRRKDDELD